MSLCVCFLLYGVALKNSRAYAYRASGRARERERERERWMDGWMDGPTDGQTDGWMDGWVDGWIERKLLVGRPISRWLNGKMDRDG